MNNVLVCGGRTFGELPIKKENSLYDQIDRSHPDYEQKLAESRFVSNVLYKELTIEADNACGYELKYHKLTIIHGDATGADRAAAEWAAVNWVDSRPYPAEWSNITRHGARVVRRADGTLYDACAGNVRNQRMLDKEHPILVIAFPGGSGTADMIRRAKLQGVPVKEFKMEQVK